MECSTYFITGCSSWTNTMNDRFDTHPGGKERKRRRKEGERWRWGGYFSSLFKLLWKIDELLAKLHPRQLLILGGFEFVQNKETTIFLFQFHFFSVFQRTVLLWKTKTHWAPCACVPERWTDSRSLRLDCVREKRKKVNLGVNEKQKLWVLFCGTSSVHWIG